ncbi:GGDEF domain-containing protein [Vibrio clamense]|uniref:diguanylate cyclase domain-containing protein n=1 Tax=Vibrio TaxID=662 RepID=UPI00352F9BB9
MKKLFNYLITQYIIYTIVPLLILGVSALSYTLIDSHHDYQSEYNQTINYQIKQASRAIQDLDIVGAENVVGKVSDLSYILSVKLESTKYDLVLSEFISDSIPGKSDKKSYLIYSQSGEAIGALTVIKDTSQIWKDLLIESVPNIILAILLLLLMSMLLSRKVLKTLKAPFHDAQRYGFLIANGDINAEPPIHQFEEFNSLFSSLDNLRDRLINSVHELKKSENRHQATYDLTQVCLFVVDIKEKQIVRSNREFETTFGSLNKVNSIELRSTLHDFIIKLANGKINDQYTLVGVNGDRHFKVNSAYLNEYQLECSALDITELVDAHSYVQKQLITDSLTGIKNRVGFNKRIEEIQANRLISTSIIMLDLNGFKPINDQYGHLVGDFLLATVAKRINVTLDKIGEVYRLGGDEFIILTNKILSDDELTPLATSLNENVSRNVNYENHEFSVTISIGSANFVAGKSEMYDVIHQADLAMYQAKTSKQTYVMAQK